MILRVPPKPQSNGIGTCLGRSICLLFFYNIWVSFITVPVGTNDVFEYTFGFHVLTLMAIVKNKICQNEVRFGMKRL